MAKPTLLILSAPIPPTRMDNYRDWTARKVASYGRVLETALSKIKKEVEVAAYSESSVEVASFDEIFKPSGPASRWEWGLSDAETKSLVAQKVAQKVAERPRKQTYAAASASRRREPQKMRVEMYQSPAKDSAFKEYLHNPNLRKQALLELASPSVRPHYATVLQHHESILKEDYSIGPNVPTLQQIAARAFGRAIVMARDPSDLEGDSKWYAYCDENSIQWRALTDTLRGHITQLLVDAMEQDWFPADLTATLIAQSVNAGDAHLTETLFSAAHRRTFDPTRYGPRRPVARRRGELAPSPFNQLLYLPDILFRQMRVAIEMNPETMLNAWFRDVMFTAISELGIHMEAPGLLVYCLEKLLGIETWESGVLRQMRRKGKQTRRKKDERFREAWIFQLKEILRHRAARMAEDLVERLFQIGWSEKDPQDVNAKTARDVMGRLVKNMVSWSDAFNHPVKELSQVSSRTAQTLAMCAVLMNGEELEVQVKPVMEELVELLLVITIEHSEEKTAFQDGKEEEEIVNFDVPALSAYIADKITRVRKTFNSKKWFVERLLDLAVGGTEQDLTKTPAPGDKSNLLQKRRTYLLATFGYHLATSLAESDKSEAAHQLVRKVEQKLVGMKIWRGGLLKASDLKTPKFSNLVRDLALSSARNNRWVYEPMLNEWVEVPSETDEASGGSSGKVVRKVSRKLDFSEEKESSEQQTDEPMMIDSDSEESDQDGDTSAYPASVDTTLTEPDFDSPKFPVSSKTSSFLVEVCIKTSTKLSSNEEESGPPSTNVGNRISDVFKQVKRTRSGDIKKIYRGHEKEPITIKTPAKILSRPKPKEGKKTKQKVYYGLEWWETTPKKRGRPRKNSVTTGWESDSDYRYGLDSDDELPRKKGKKEPLGQVNEGDKVYQTRSAQKKAKLEIYQDELDLTSTTFKPGKGKRQSAGAIVLKDSGESKLNENVVRGRKRKSEALDVPVPAKRGRPRKSI